MSRYPEVSSAGAAVPASIFARLREHLAKYAASGGDVIPLQIGDTHLPPPATLEAVTWAELAPTVEKAVADCQQMREREGKALADELELRFGLLEKGVAEIERLAPARVVRERDRLRAAVAELLDGRTVDEQRLARELAFLAEKPEEVRKRIQKHGVEMHYRSFPDAKLFQIFLRDPDDVTIELNFLGEVIDEKEWKGKGSASAVTLDRSAGRRTAVRKQN